MVTRASLIDTTRPPISTTSPSSSASRAAAMTDRPPGAPLDTALPVGHGSGEPVVQPGEPDDPAGPGPGSLPVPVEVGRGDGEGPAVGPPSASMSAALRGTRLRR